MKKIIGADKTAYLAALAGAIFLLASVPSHAAKAPFAPAPYYAPEKQLTIDDARIYYLDQGEGDVLVLVHGWAGNAWNWMSVFEPLAKKHRVIVLDLPGHGKSGCPRGFTFTMPAYADLVARVLDELGVERATLVGSSMGGAVVAWAAIRHPDRVSSLVLVDAAGTSVQNKLMTAAGFLASPSTVIPLIHLAFPVNEKSLAAVPESERRRVELAEELYASNRGKCAGTALAKSMRSLSKDVVDDHLPEVRARTLVIWGSDDGLLPIEAGELYRDHVPGAVMEVIEGGNHTPMQWRPERFLEVLEKFLAG